MHREKSFDKNKKLITEIFKKNPYLLINILEKYYPINFSLFIKLEKNKIISLSTIQNNNNIIWCNNFNNKYIEESYKENEFNLESFYSFKVKPKFKLNDLKENFEKYDWKPIKEVLFDFDNNQEITDEIYKFYYLSNVENRFDLPIQKIFNNSATWQEYFFFHLSENIINYFSNKENINWSIEFIKNNINGLNPQIICNNKQIQWSEELIDNLPSFLLNWNSLSKNENLPWSINFISKYRNKWDWVNITNNKSIPWSKELIKKFENELNLTSYKFRNIKIIQFITKESILYNKFLKHFSYFKWEEIASDEEIIWTNDVLEEYKNELRPFIYKLIEVGKIENIEYFIEEKTNWYFISKSTNIIWSLNLIEKYREFWYWSELSNNTSLPWTSFLIDKYKKYWDWDKLCQNESILWTEELLEKYQEKINWKKLSLNNKIQWSTKLIEKFKNHWDWYNLSNNEKIPWSSNLIEKFEDNWDWERLSRNTEIKWSDYFIEKYKYIFNLNISNKTRLNWTLENIYKYANNFHEIDDEKWNLMKIYIDENIILESEKEILKRWEEENELFPF